MKREGLGGREAETEAEVEAEAEAETEGDAVGVDEVILHPEQVALLGCVFNGKHSLTLRVLNGTLHHTHPASRSHVAQSG